jgi:hypothetical protein
VIRFRRGLFWRGLGRYFWLFQPRRPSPKTHERDEVAARIANSSSRRRWYRYRRDGHICGRAPLVRDASPVPAFTQDLNALADWLSCRGIKTVAVESTGVYWIPLFPILEACGFRPA